MGARWNPQWFFILGLVIALTMNYPNLEEQRRRMDGHARAALTMAATLFAALFSICPPVLDRHLPVLLGLLSMPLSFLFDPTFSAHGALQIEMGEHQRFTALAVRGFAAHGAGLSL